MRQQNLVFLSPRNLGDVLYTFRYRRALPEAISATAPDGKEWTIRGAGPMRSALSVSIA